MAQWVCVKWGRVGWGRGFFLDALNFTLSICSLWLLYGLINGGGGFQDKSSVLCHVQLTLWVLTMEGLQSPVSFHRKLFQIDDQDSHPLPTPTTASHLEPLDDHDPAFRKTVVVESLLRWPKSGSFWCNLHAASLVAQLARYLGREDPLEKGMATHSSILEWEIPRTEEPGGPWGHKSQTRLSD